MTETTAAIQTPERPGRRVGTFTLGVTLVVCGGAMLVSLFWSDLPTGWMLRLSPAVLILLGVEVLLAARGGGKVRYDWLGMFLCFLLTVFALGLYGSAWWMLDGPGLPVYNGSWIGGQDSLVIRYDYFNDFRGHAMDLAAGDRLDITCDNREGWLNIEIYSMEEWELVYEGDLTEQASFQVDIPAAGEYYIELSGHKAAGRAAFTRVPGETADTPEGEAVPEGETAPEMSEAAA